MVPRNRERRRNVSEAESFFRARRGVIRTGRALRVALPPLAFAAVLADVVKKACPPALLRRAERPRELLRQPRHALQVLLQQLIAPVLAPMSHKLFLLFHIFPSLARLML